MIAAWQYQRGFSGFAELRKRIAEIGIVYRALYRDNYLNDQGVDELRGRYANLKKDQFLSLTAR